MFKVYIDPGHGWVAVKRALLTELGIAEKITQYSYQKGKTVYLEEDCDLNTFFVAYEAKFGTKPVLAKSSYSHNSPIRSYERYRLNAVVAQ